MNEDADNEAKRKIKPEAAKSKPKRVRVFAFVRVCVWQCVHV